MTSRIIGPELVFNAHSRIIGDHIVITPERTNYGATRTALYQAIKAIDPTVPEKTAFLAFTIGGWQIKLVSDQLSPKQFRSLRPDVTRYTSLALTATREGRDTKIGRQRMLKLLPQLAWDLARSIPMLTKSSVLI